MILLMTILLLGTASAAKRERKEGEIIPSSVEHSLTYVDQNGVQYVADNAIDLDFDTKTQSNADADGNYWLKMNLDKPYCVEKVEEYNGDGSNQYVWTCSNTDCSVCVGGSCELFTLTVTKERSQEQDPPASGCKYGDTVKLEFDKTYASTNNRVLLVIEIAVFEKKAKRERKEGEIIPSSVEHSLTYVDQGGVQYVADNAIDLDFDTKAQSNADADGNYWLKMNLDKPYCVEKVEEYNGDGSNQYVWTCSSTDCSACVGGSCELFTLTVTKERSQEEDPPASGCKYGDTVKLEFDKTYASTNNRVLLVIEIAVFEKKEPCKAGEYEKDGECKQCGENTYSGEGATECTQCEEGKVSAPGSTSEQDCKVREDYKEEKEWENNSASRGSEPVCLAAILVSARYLI